jgi:hypothetical protein
MAIQADLDKGGNKWPVPPFSMGPSLGVWSRAVPILDVTLPPFGADPTGSRDSTAPILAAIAALPSGGGGLYLPGIFNISSPLVFTQSGTFILGNDDLQTGLSQINWVGSALAGPMIDFVGAGKGGGIRGIGLNGNSLAATALRLTAWSNGRFDDFYTVNFTGTNVILRSLTTSPVGSANCQYNRFSNYNLFPGNFANAAGVLLDGNGVNTNTNTSFNSFNEGQIVLSVGTTTLRGVTCRDCDSNDFNNLTVFGGGSGTSPIVFDYTGASAGVWPANNNFIGYDPDGAFTAIGHVNVGSPAGGARPNRFDFIYDTNTAVYPKLINTSYKPEFVNPGISVVGQTATLANTSLNGVPIYLSGMYRINYVIEVTTAGSGGTLQVAVTWTDDAGTHTNIALGGPMNLNALASASSLFVERLLSGTNVQMSVTLAGATGGPQYAFYARLEKMD